MGIFLSVMWGKFSGKCSLYKCKIRQEPEEYWCAVFVSVNAGKYSNWKSVGKNATSIHKEGKIAFHILFNT